MGLGPEHDWSSHSADAFGMMAVDYQDPSRSAKFNRDIEYPDMGWRGTHGTGRPWPKAAKLYAYAIKIDAVVAGHHDASIAA